MTVMDITTEQGLIDFSATGLNEVAQNIRMILTTPAYSCPMDREFAWAPDVDAPINIAQAKMSSRIAAAIRLYEPRAQLVSVKFDSDPLNGVLRPIVRVNISEGVGP